MMKDQSRSTWWQTGEQREHFVKWMQNNNIKPVVNNMEAQTNDSESK